MALPEQFQIKEYAEALQLLDDLRAKVESGEVMSVLAVSELVDGSMGGWCTSTQNIFAISGYMLAWAMMRMGFVRDEKLLTKEEDE